MKYASEVIGLLAAHPSRKFRMANVVNHIDRNAQGAARLRIRVGALRVLRALEEHGKIEVCEPESRGGTALYQWKSDTSAWRDQFKSDTGTDTLSARTVAP